MKSIVKLIPVAAAMAAFLSACSPSPSQEAVNIYSSRNEALVKPLLDEFTAETGIQVNLLTGSGDGLLTRLQNEGENSPADLFLTVDAGALHRAKSANLFQSVNSTTLANVIPAHLRDSDNEWFGLSMRARPIFYAKDRVDPAELGSYLDLADAKWRGRICVRSSDNIYNQSLVAAMIDHFGEEQTEAWARGLVANFARDPVGGDRDQLHAVASGQCDVAIANTYYFGGMIASGDAANLQTTDQLEIFWPSQDAEGVHVNVSGIGLLRHTENTENAIKLIEFLASESSQAWYAEANQEYPVRQDAALSDILQGWGDFKADQIPMSRLGENNAAAVRLMNRAGWR
ncbi:Fe(3+) ABC transporter substrate-binding protein [Aliidiomarina celeris]|uniref:Fe(3+) ABC transporter substrate-binding protein n=1 Tax=Aliidiomarina celeris TaxID=2249428 RepID=UPI000DEA397C|nr:Fe(3+) ABC transporter substrate-binding protein [Aliidiomarina celeris]